MTRQLSNITYRWPLSLTSSTTSTLTLLISTSTPSSLAVGHQIHRFYLLSSESSKPASPSASKTILTRASQQHSRLLASVSAFSRHPSFITGQPMSGGAQLHAFVYATSYSTPLVVHHKQKFNICLIYFLFYIYRLQVLEFSQV